MNSQKNEHFQVFGYWCKLFSENLLWTLINFLVIAIFSCLYYDKVLYNGLVLLFPLRTKLKHLCRFRFFGRRNLIKTCPFPFRWLYFILNTQLLYNSSRRFSLVIDVMGESHDGKRYIKVWYLFCCVTPLHSGHRKHDSKK